MAVLNNSEQHRAECEAREVMKWSEEKRKGYYLEVAKQRGVAAKDRLREEVNRQHGLKLISDVRSAKSRGQ